MRESRSRKELAFNLMELTVILSIVAILLCILVPMFNKARMRSQSICCNCNLKQITFGSKTWAADHTNSFPMNLSTNENGTREYNLSGDVFPHFRVMSNELGTPKALLCPRDSRKPATDFDTAFAN